MVEQRKRITLSLNLDIPEDRTILEFLEKVPRRARSDVIKEILFDAAQRDPPATACPEADLAESGKTEDPERIIDRMF